MRSEFIKVFHVKHIKITNKGDKGKMKTFAIRGKAINLLVRAESKEEAAQIVHAPIVESWQHLTSVKFEHVAREEAAQ